MDKHLLSHQEVVYAHHFIDIMELPFLPTFIILVHNSHHQLIVNEPCHRKTGYLPMQKQRCRSAVQ